MDTLSKLSYAKSNKKSKTSKSLNSKSVTVSSKTDNEVPERVIKEKKRVSLSVSQEKMS